MGSMNGWSTAKTISKCVEAGLHVDVFDVPDMFKAQACELKHEAEEGHVQLSKFGPKSLHTYLGKRESVCSCHMWAKSRSVMVQTVCTVQRLIQKN